MPATPILCPFAVWQPSPNFTRGIDFKPRFAVVHITDGQPDARRAVSRLCEDDTDASAHFLAGQEGELFQLVSLGDVAWHAGASKAARRKGLKGWNFESIGIEHPARTPGEFDDKWSGLSEKTRRKLLPANTSDEQIHRDSDPGFPPSEKQLQISARLVAWLCDLYGWPVDRDHIRGHFECPATTHDDCGRGTEDGGIWPWESYLESVRGALEELREARTSTQPREPNPTVDSEAQRDA